MNRRAAILLLLVSAFAVAVQYDNPLRRWLVPSPPNSTADVTRRYPVSHLLPMEGHGSTRQAEAQRLAHALSSRRFQMDVISGGWSPGQRPGPIIHPVYDQLIVIAKPSDQKWIASVLSQTQQLHPGEQGSLLPATDSAEPLSGSSPATLDDRSPPTAALRHRIAEIDLTAMPREVVFQKVAAMIGLEVRLSDRISAAQRQAIDLPVVLQDVTAEKVLTEMCRPYKGHPPLAFDVIDGIIHVMPEQDLIDQTWLRVYDVRDLSPNQWARYPGAWIGFDNENSPGSADFTGDQALITYFVTPSSWNEYGGRLGSILKFEGRLIITQTRENHRRVSALLAVVRKGKTPSAKAGGE